jgi:hypothetical protein
LVLCKSCWSAGIAGRALVPRTQKAQTASIIRLYRLALCRIQASPTDLFAFRNAISNLFGLGVEATPQSNHFTNHGSALVPILRIASALCSRSARLYPGRATSFIHPLNSLPLYTGSLSRGHKSTTAATTTAPVNTILITRRFTPRFFHTITEH